jgi:hypothetical protein
MPYPFRSILFIPLPEKPTPAEWWSINLIVHELRAWTQAMIAMETKYAMLIKVLVDKKIVRDKDFTPDIIKQLEPLARDRYIEPLQAIDRFQAWLQATASKTAPESPGPTPPPIPTD